MIWVEMKKLEYFMNIEASGCKLRKVADERFRWRRSDSILETFYRDYLRAKRL